MLRVVGCALLICAWATACSRPAKQPAEREAEAAPAREPMPAPSAIPEAEGWAMQVGKPPVPGAQPRDGRTEVRAAFVSDAVEDSAELVPVQRLVYRVGLSVPGVLRDRNARVTGAAGELHVDVSEQRLRARFVGPGWPVPEGIELRLRADVPGVYVFDDHGGRSIGPGMLASWFEGRAQGGMQSRVRVRREYRTVPDAAAPGALVCALLAEWTGQDREALDHRCTPGLPPPGFHFGPWSAELTAVVPMRLPRYQLRADEVDAPPPLPPSPSGAMLDATAIARVVPQRPLAAEPDASVPAGPATLEVINATETRAIVIVQGVALGWVAPGQSARFSGFAPGRYRVGALRPLGILRMPPKTIDIPGVLQIGR